MSSESNEQTSTGTDEPSKFHPMNEETSTGEPSRKRKRSDDSLMDSVEVKVDEVRVGEVKVNELEVEDVKVDEDRIKDNCDKDYARRMAFLEKEFENDEPGRIAAMKNLIYCLITDLHRVEEQLRTVCGAKGDLLNQLGTAQLEVKRNRYILGIRGRIEQLVRELYPRWLPEPPNDVDKWKIIFRRVGHFRVNQLLKRLEDAKIEVDVCLELISSLYDFHPNEVHSVTSEELTAGDKDSVFKNLGTVDKDTQQILLILTEGFGVASELHVPHFEEEQETAFKDFRTVRLDKVPLSVATSRNIRQFFSPEVEKSIQSVNIDLAHYGIILVEFQNTADAILAMKNNDGKIHRRVIEVSLYGRPKIN